jgi:hypothetical protein
MDTMQKRNSDFYWKGSKNINKLKVQLTHNYKIYSVNDLWAKSRQSSIILWSSLNILICIAILKELLYTYITVMHEHNTNPVYNFLFLSEYTHFYP